MSPRSKKKASRRSGFPPLIKLLKIIWLCEQGARARREARARRANNKILYALMNEINSMEKRRVAYQPGEPDIIAWEKFLPFEGNILRGERSDQDYTGSWTCLCGTENEPSRRRLFDIPALKCRFCSREAPEDLDFDFVYEPTLLNGMKTIRHIRQQKDGYCAPNAWTSASEMDQTIETALEGRSDIIQRPLNVEDLIEKHQMWRKRIRKANNRLEDFHIAVSDDELNMDAMQLLGAVAKVCGISEQGSKKKHKIDSPMKLDKNDFAEICTAIADGPVVATFRPGVNFGDLAYGRIYKATDTEKFLFGDYEDEQHAVVLVGAGRRRRKKYFHFLNSHGRKFCLRVSKKEKFFPGGVGMIRAKDLTSDPIHLRRKAKM